jgi:Leu/Phe-tRNA-protein transferase
MHSSSLLLSFATLFMMVLLIDAATLTTPQLSAENVNYMSSGMISPKYFTTTTPTLLENCRKYLYKLLRLVSNVNGSESLDPNEEFVPEYLRQYMRFWYEDYWISCVFDPIYFAHIMYHGFLPIACQEAGAVYALPKLHIERCVLDPKILHIPKSVRKKAKYYTLTFNKAFDSVVKGCHDQHGEDWLYPDVVRVFRALLSGILVFENQVRVISVELWKGDQLVAGELGYVSGAVYTSLTGFVSPEASGAGTVQLYALGSYLHARGFQLWDLGMSMDYKLKMGARDIPRVEFLKKIHALRSSKVSFRNDKINAKNIMDQHILATNTTQNK